MMNKYLRLILVVIVVLGIAMLAKSQVAWADQDNSAGSVVALEQGELAVLQAKPEPGSVKPPPGYLSICENGRFSVGGVATLEIKDLKPGYCVEAILWNPRFQIHRLPEDSGQALAHFLFLRIYFTGNLIHEVPAGDGTIEACYAIPPEKQANFYYYDFFWKRFNKETKPLIGWNQVETRFDDQKKTACAFTQISGVYGLIGK